MAQNAPYVAEGPLGTDDFQKLRVNSSGELLINGAVSGTLRLLGASSALQVKKIIITDVPTLIKTDSPERDSMAARVMGFNPVYLGPSNVTVADGYPKFQYEEIIADIKAVAATEIYGICETGKTSEVRVIEIEI